jgi:hypothetical protein
MAKEGELWELYRGGRWRDVRKTEAKEDELRERGLGGPWRPNGVLPVFHKLIK